MPTCQIKLFCLSILLLLSTAWQCSAQTPAPKLQANFPISLADNTTGTAAFLPAPNAQIWLVYATPSGKLGLWSMTTTSPTPPPEPTPPPKPTPPDVLPPLPDWILPAAPQRHRACKGNCRWK